MWRSRSRLAKLAHAIETRPIPPAAIDAAFGRFRESGELPDHLRLARTVVDRTLQWTMNDCPDLLEGIRQLKRLADAAQAGEELPSAPSDLRRHLLLEAVSENDFVRRIARIVIETIVGMGRACWIPSSCRPTCRRRSTAPWACTCSTCPSSS